ncbi:MAG TPA: hypothetical protein VH502_16365 [Actinoplanes sp.]|jgi:hypothetical protein
MSTAAERAAELRALADQHEVIGGLEETLNEAAEAYRADPSEANKAAYAEASGALRDARQNLREAAVTVAPATAGSTTISGAGVGGGKVG